MDQILLYAPLPLPYLVCSPRPQGDLTEKLPHLLACFREALRMYRKSLKPPLDLIFLSLHEHSCCTLYEQDYR